MVNPHYEHSIHIYNQLRGVELCKPSFIRSNDSFQLKKKERVCFIAREKERERKKKFSSSYIIIESQKQVREQEKIERETEYIRLPLLN